MKVYVEFTENHAIDVYYPVTDSDFVKIGMLIKYRRSNGYGGGQNRWYICPNKVVYPKPVKNTNRELLEDAVKGIELMYEQAIGLKSEVLMSPGQVEAAAWHAYYMQAVG